MTEPAPERDPANEGQVSTPPRDWREVPDAVRARRIIYIAMAIGITLPFILILVVHLFTKK